jgi:hypothetical protein
VVGAGGGEVIIMDGCCGDGTRLPVGETKVRSVGFVDPEMALAVTRTEEIGSDAGAPEEIVGLHQMEGNAKRRLE